MENEPTITYVQHGKKTFRIIETNINEPSPEALAQAAIKLRKILVNAAARQIDTENEASRKTDL